MAATLAAIACCVAAQQAQKPLTNDRVVQMVKARLSESVIVAAIQSSPANYDVSADRLISLKQPGVTENEMKSGRQ